MKKVVLLILLMFCFANSVWAEGRTTVLSRSVNNGSITGNIPEVDAISDDNMRKSINEVLKARSYELAQALQSDCVIGYTRLLDRASIFSIMLEAKAGEKTLYKAVNIDVTTGKECVIGDFFRDKEGLLKSLGGYEDIAFGETGIYTRNDNFGSYETFVPYSKILRYVDIGEAGRFLTVHKLTGAAAGSKLHINEGELVAVKLDSNRSSGYLWELNASSKSSGLLEIGTSYIMPANQENKSVGSKGIDIIVLGAAEPGRYPVKLDYKRQWEKYPLSTAEFELIVETKTN